MLSRVMKKKISIMKWGNVNVFNMKETVMTAFQIQYL